MSSFRAVVAVVFLVVAACANAEPPRFRSNRFNQFQRQEQDPSAPSTPAEENGDAPYPPAASAPYPPATAPYPPAMPAEAPYPPSNWKPSGRLFALPSRQAQLRDTYGPPTTQQPAEPEPTEAPEEETTDEAVTGTTTEPLAETIEVDEDKAQEENKPQRLTQGGPGFYYVQLPQLQQQQQSQQLVYVNPAQVQSAQLRQFPVSAQAVAQPAVVYTNQQLVLPTTGYYVSTQSWWFTVGGDEIGIIEKIIFIQRMWIKEM